MLLVVATMKKDKFGRCIFGCGFHDLQSFIRRSEDGILVIGRRSAWCTKSKENVERIAPLVGGIEMHPTFNNQSISE